MKGLRPGVVPWMQVSSRLREDALIPTAPGADGTQWGRAAPLCWAVTDPNWRCYKSSRDYRRMRLSSCYGSMRKKETLPGEDAVLQPFPGKKACGVGPDAVLRRRSGAAICSERLHGAAQRSVGQPRGRPTGLALFFFCGGRKGDTSGRSIRSLTDHS